ncbi:MAG: radical SAM protein, partial [Candidatus Altiarchaeota archaeon]|nr:radical SAM protein [Candidatus Altiarchaeota archaeon]
MTLEHYLAVRKGKTEPKFFSAELSKKIRTASRMLSNCVLCERLCKINRNLEEFGYCKAPDYACISSEFLHFGEESFLVPSHTVFFMGCNLSCMFCQNYTISNWFEKGKKMSVDELVRIVKLRHGQGSRNINFVGGEPTPYLPFILKILRKLKSCDVRVPVVWNSNFYMSKKAMELLEGVVDLWLPDFKYGNSECAKRLSNADKYMDIVPRNLLKASENGDICVRHLVLPNHVECCTKPL